MSTAERSPLRDPLTGREMRDPNAKADKLAAAREEAQALNFDYSAMFGTGVGKTILADLEAQFGGSPIVPGDPYATHARAGAQEVMLYIRDRMRIQDDGR